MAEQNFSGPIASFLGQQFKQPSKQQAIKGIINSRIHDFLQNRLKTALPGLAPFIDQLLIEEFKQAMDSEIETQLPSMLNEIVETTAYDFDDKQLEAAVKDSDLGRRYKSEAKQEVVWWTVMGILMGTAIGFTVCAFYFNEELLSGLFATFSK